jgi:hypothetical protein
MDFKELDCLLCSLIGQIILIEDLFGKPFNEFSLIGKKDDKGPRQKKDKRELFESTIRAPSHYDKLKNVEIKIGERFQLNPIKQLIW